MPPSLNWSSLRSDFRRDFSLFKPCPKSEHREAQIFDLIEKSIWSIFDQGSKIWLRACSTREPLRLRVSEFAIGGLQGLCLRGKIGFTSWLRGSQNPLFRGSGVGNSDFRCPEVMLKLTSISGSGVAPSSRPQILVPAAASKMAHFWVNFQNFSEIDQIWAGRG